MDDEVQNTGSALHISDVSKYTIIDGNCSLFFYLHNCQLFSKRGILNLLLFQLM